MLYNHRTDPQENFNVVNEPGYVEKVIELKEILHHFYKDNIVGK